MERAILIVLFVAPALCMAQSRPFTVDDLLTLSSIPQKNIGTHLEKKGFSLKRRSIRDNQMGFTYFENKRNKDQDSLKVNRSIDLYKKGDNWCIALHTSSLDEYLDGRNQLKKLGFFCGNKDTGMAASLLFQKRTIAITTNSAIEDENPDYTILLKKKELPDPASVRNAEDLLKFDSHEYLVGFFGEDNVEKNVYKFSDKESKKCSVLFPNSSDQVVFIWDDEYNFHKLSFILISGILSTTDAVHYSGSFSQNKWVLKNGIYPGMRIGDLLKINANDFKFFGNDSDYSLMVEPKVTGNINFKWIGIMLNCFNCDRALIMDKSKVSATDAVKNNLALHVSYIMISP